MKYSHLILFLFGLVLNGKQAFAQGDQIVLRPLDHLLAYRDFCSDPVKAICQAPSSYMMSRKERFKVVATQIFNRAEQQTIRQMGLPNYFKMQNLSTFGSAWDRIRIPPVFNRNLNEAISEFYSRVERRSLDRHGETVRNYVIQAIENEFALLAPYAPSGGVFLQVQKSLLLSKIREVRILKSSEVFALAENDPTKGKAVLEGYYQTCGLDGAGDNAFAIQSGGVPYLVICPGLLMSALGAGSQDYFNLLNLIHVAAHELAHHIDSASYQSLYLGYLDCLGKKDNSWRSLLDPIRNPELEKTFDPSVKGSDMQYLRTMATHAREITADYWAARAVGRYLSTMSAIMNGYDRLEVLQQSHEYLCGTEDEGIHPTGDYRIRHISYEASAIRGFMGCGVPLRSCSFLDKPVDLK